MEKLRRPRGTRDFLPADMAFRREVEGGLSACARRFGYGEVMTPTFEHTELFTEKSGEEVVEQIYSFTDKGGRGIALRPELTAATIRLYSEGMRDAPMPVRLYYFENCFRYERPQKGRYREFWQFGAELIGPDTPEADAEIVHLARSVLKGVGLENFNMRVGHVGILKSVIRWCGLGEAGNGDSPQAGEKNGEGDGGGGRGGGIMSLIDKGDMAGLERACEAGGLSMDDPRAQTLLAVVEGRGRAPDVIARITPLLRDIPEALEGLERLEATAGLLDSFGMDDHDVDLAIARGLDYYTGVVFECDIESLGAEKQVLGGGRYELAHLFDLRPTPMTGFALGFDRLLLGLELEGKAHEAPGPDVYVIAFGKDDIAEAQAVMARLRDAGIRAEGDLSGRAMKKVLAHASHRRARYIVFVGGEEGKRGSVVLKNGETREQEEVPKKQLEDRLREFLSA